MVYLRLCVAVALVISILIHNSVLCSSSTISSFTSPKAGDFIRLSRRYRPPLASGFVIPLFDIDLNKLDLADLPEDIEKYPDYLDDNINGNDNIRRSARDLLTLNPLLKHANRRRSQWPILPQTMMTSTTKTSNEDEGKSIGKKRNIQESDVSDIHSEILKSLSRALPSYDEEPVSTFFNDDWNVSVESKNMPSKRHPFTEFDNLQDFPYWNLLRQKWLLSAKPRSLSQVRMLQKRVGKETIDKPIDKRSFFYILNLLQRNRSNRSSPPEINNFSQYHKCYLNNIACWRK